MSMSDHSFLQLKHHLLTGDSYSHGTSDMTHMESPDATQQENIHPVSLCNGCYLYPLRLSSSHSGCDQRSKAWGYRPTTRSYLACYLGYGGVCHRYVRPLYVYLHTC
jgi:hypothetical protein